MGDKRKNSLTLFSYFKKKPKTSYLDDSCEENDSILQISPDASVQNQITEVQMEHKNNEKVGSDLESLEVSENAAKERISKSSSDVGDQICENPNDIAVLRQTLKHMSREEKFDNSQKVWEPQENYVFPTSATNEKFKRRFQHKWLLKYKWLVYSKAENSVYCRYCVFFAPTEVGKSGGQMVGKLVTSGFSKWKHAIECFEAHKKNEYHVKSVFIYEKLLEERKGKMISVDKLLDSQKIAQAELNRKRLVPIVKTVLFCGRQGIPLRAHKDYGEFSTDSPPSENEGNFRALLRFRIDAGDEDLKQHIKTSGKNATYISWKMQNEMLTCCNEIILKKIVSRVNAAKCFAILADETTDIATTEQFSLCVRYVEENPITVCEQFLQFVPVANTSGQELANVLVESLKRFGLDLSFWRGQGYDGAGSMSGKFKGIQSIITSSFPQALYVHCASHVLNLAIGKAAHLPSIRNSTGVMEKIYTFFNTPKRNNVLQKMISLHAPESKKKKLLQLSPTRWVQRHESVMVDLFDALYYALQEISTWEDNDSSASAAVLLNSLLDTTFIISLYVLQLFFSYTLPLSRLLQAVSGDLGSAMDCVSDVMSQLKNVRQNATETFHDVFELA